MQSNQRDVALPHICKKKTVIIGCHVFHFPAPQEGGVDSGFRRAQGSGAVHRLYQIKGKRNIRAKEVELSWASFNKGDCFILDLGEVGVEPLFGQHYSHLFVCATVAFFCVSTVWTRTRLLGWKRGTWASMPDAWVHCQLTIIFIVDSSNDHFFDETVNHLVSKM